MPELVPSVCKDPHIHLPSTWKEGRGSLLTNSKIEKYLKAGHYGRDKIPKDEVHPCLGCRSTKKTRQLLSGAYWCEKCRKAFREKEQQDKQKWLKKLTELFA